MRDFLWFISFGLVKPFISKLKVAIFKEHKTCPDMAASDCVGVAPFLIHMTVGLRYIPQVCGLEILAVFFPNGNSRDVCIMVGLVFPERNYAWSTHRLRNLPIGSGTCSARLFTW